MARVKQNPAENFDKPLAVRLRALIKESGRSKADLGKEIGVSRQAINDYTLGNSVPDANNLLKLAKYFGVTSDYLLGLDEARTHEQSDAAKMLALSGATIQHLCRLQEQYSELCAGGEMARALDALLTVSSLPDFLSEVVNFAQARSIHYLSMEEQWDYQMQNIVDTNQQEQDYQQGNRVTLSPVEYEEYWSYRIQRTFGDMIYDIVLTLCGDAK